MKRSKGTTLIELLIYCVLLLLILGAVYASYSIARDYYAAAQLETEAQQAAMDASLAVSRELAHAAEGSITLSDSPPAILFLSARTDPGPFQHDPTTGALLWQRWVCIYLDTNTNELKKLDLLLSNPVPDIPSPSPTIQTVLSDASLDEQTLAHHITEFSRGITAGPSVLFQVRSSLDATRMASGQSVTTNQDATTQIVLATEVPIRQ
jgi:type II secretory pathway component PulJ